MQCIAVSTQTNSQFICSLKQHLK